MVVESLMFRSLLSRPGCSAALALSFVTAPALAQSLKPGLWENTFTLKSSSGTLEKGMAEMQAQMAKLPPEQRKMMEQMLAQQGVGMGPKGNSIKFCMTPEEAAKMEVPAAEGDCKQTVTKRSASVMAVSFSCTGNPPSSGQGEFTFQSSTAYSGKSVVNTVVDGKPERMDMDTKGKWLSSDCGAIKPVKRP
jgi:Protein of unknown function (DUF3617)